MHFCMSKVAQIMDLNTLSAFGYFNGSCISSTLFQWDVCKSITFEGNLKKCENNAYKP